MNNEHTLKITDTFKLLSDPTRLKILGFLFRSREEVCVNEIADAIGMSHSATSHQLAKLEARGVVECFRRGQSMCYQIKDGPVTRKIKKAVMIFE